MKPDVAGSFSSAARQYDLYASVQRKAADRLVEFLQPFIRFVDGPVLEFGCGTGFITERTAKWWNNFVKSTTGG